MNEIDLRRFNLNLLVVIGPIVKSKFADLGDEEARV